MNRGTVINLTILHARQHTEAIRRCCFGVCFGVLDNSYTNTFVLGEFSPGLFSVVLLVSNKTSFVIFTVHISFV